MRRVQTPNAAQHCRVQFLCHTPRKAANPESHTTRSGFQMTSPFYCLQQSSYAEPRAGGKVFHMAQFAAPSNTRGVSSKRMGISSHIFWCRIVAIWAILLKSYNFKLLHSHIWGEVQSQWTGAEGCQPLGEINKNAEKLANQRLSFSCLTTSQKC